MSVGSFGILDSESNVTETGMEVHFPRQSFAFLPDWAEFRPVFGVSVTARGAFWLVAGIRTEFDLGERWLISPNFAATFYDRGNGKRLGSDLEFRSALDVELRVSPRVRFGLTIHHLSNGGISQLNPGSESLLFTFTHESN